MSARSRLRTCWKAVFHGGELSRQVKDELEFHVESRAADLMRGGMGREGALRRARIEIGSREQVREECSKASGALGVRAFAGDLRYALRSLQRSPGFALAAVATLALGIGAVTSVFSVVNTVLLKPFAFRDPGRLVVVREIEDEIRSEKATIPDNYLHYARLKGAAKSLQDAAIFHDRALSVSPDGNRPRMVGGIRCSPNMLRVLGVQPVMGRDFTAADAVKGADNVAILSYDGWQSLAGGDPNVVGKTLRLDGDPVTVIGVLARGVKLPRIAWGAKIAGAPGGSMDETMVYQPFVPTKWDLTHDTGNFNYKVIGRLKPGVTVAQAQAELDGLQRAYTRIAHLPIHLGAVVTPLAKDVTAGIGSALWLMFAAVCGVLLIGCVNLANLQLARAVTAERETAVRAALGASRGRLISARLAESTILASAGGAAGVALAFGGVKLLLALAPANVPRLHEVRVSLSVLAFAAGVSVAAALISGILPALGALRVHPEQALCANTARAANTREGWRARSLLVAGQVGCTVVLLVVTGLLLRSFSRLLQQARGFDTAHVTVALVELFTPEFSDTVPHVAEAKLALADRTLTALRQLPGVQSAALTSWVPLTGETWVDDLTRPDHPVAEGQRPMVNVRWINPDYLKTMRIPLIEGRNFAESDRNNPDLVLISERTAREAFAGEDSLGKTIETIVPDGKKPATVIGVVADARVNGLKDTAAMVYAPYWAFTPWTLAFLVKSEQPGEALVSEMRQTIWSIDPRVAIPTLKPLDEQVSDSVATERFQTLILASFGGAALLLALLGIYGVLAYSVSMRTQEFGIRMALGSSRSSLVGLVLRQAAGPVVLGAGAGLALALAAASWMRSMLYETSPVDPVAITGSLLLLFAAAALAALLPARRAAGVDPAQAIRNE